MAASHVALLRGINVGRAKRIAMGDLRQLTEGLGFRDVRTLLNSGNVVFAAPRADTRAHARRLERAVLDRLGIASRVTVLHADELAAIVRENAIVGLATNPSLLFVTVITDPKDVAALASLAGRRWAPEALHVGSRASYLWCPNGSIDSPLNAAVSKALGDGATTRNWATVGKLHALISDAAEPAAAPRAKAVRRRPAARRARQTR